MKRTRLVRKTPLAPISAKRLAALQTSAASGIQSAKVGRCASRRPRIEPAVPLEVRAALQKRSSGWCEAQLAGCWGAAIDPHHRITRKNGGRKGAAKERSDRLSDLLYLCRPCHRFAHGPMSITQPMGLRLKEHQVPPQESVQYRGRRVFLDDFGGVHEYEAHCA